MKSLVIIKDNVEEHEDYLLFKDSSIKCYFISLNELVNNPPDTLPLADKSEHNIICIKNEIYTPDVESKLKEVFRQNYDLDLPSRIILTNRICDREEEKRLVRSGTAFYLLPENDSQPVSNYRYNFRLFIISVFENVVTVNRLNSYIMDSFQNIIDTQLITRQKEEIELLNKELDTLSKTDPLTKLLNRRAFFSSLQMEIKRTNRDKWRIEQTTAETPGVTFKEKSATENIMQGSLHEHIGIFSCLMLDIDHFKNINDTYGHQVGDEVIKTMGEFLRSSDIFRDNDIAARYGGEEFIIILPATNAKNAKIPAARLREAIKAKEFLDEDKKVFHVTVSIGISEYDQADQSEEDLINKADKALYYAKEHGRDQIVLYNDIEDETFK